MRSRLLDKGLTREFLSECFDYDRADGKVHWKVRPEDHFTSNHAAKCWNSRFAGKRVGHAHTWKAKRGDGPRVNIFGANRKLSKLVYFMCTGNWVEFVTSKNRNSSDLSFKNLLPVTQCQMNWYWRKGIKDHVCIFRIDKSWRTTHKFNQILFRRYFTDKSKADEFAADLDSRITEYIVNQNPNDLKDGPLFKLIEEAYEQPSPQPYGDKS